MVDAGINEGDLVVIRKQETACVGDIVVALDENNENTLKKFAGIDKNSHCAILQYQNKKQYKNKEIRVKELVVQGVAKKVIKSL